MSKKKKIKKKKKSNLRRRVFIFYFLFFIFYCSNSSISVQEKGQLPTYRGYLCLEPQGKPWEGEGRNDFVEEKNLNLLEPLLLYMCEYILYYVYMYTGDIYRRGRVV